MRKGMWLAAFLGLLLAAPAWAQSNGGPSQTSFGGVDPTQLTYAPVNTGYNSTVPLASPQSLSPTGNSLLHFIPSFNFFRPTKTVVGTSTFPTAAQLPGADYFAAFGYVQPHLVKRSAHSFSGGS